MDTIEFRLSALSKYGNESSPASHCVFELAKSLLSGQKMESVSRGRRGFLDRLFGC
ncbi:MAG: hypothetical protein IKP64_07685 [Selenomonadaceae bacterium]|nr:hypothetical protein [Selenomonadaceae bacterium]MBR4383423.1 hypothetical protein [Selenomonadaceae bacterium]